MFNKLNSSYKKKQLSNCVDEPPEKRITSDGDILIKELAEKQRCTKTNLKEQLSIHKEFYKGTEFIPLTSYASGSSSLEDFHKLNHQSDEVEQLKSAGLTSEEIELFLDKEKSNEYLYKKHKVINSEILDEQLENIEEKIKISKSKSQAEEPPVDRLKWETALATKPLSIETKLLKFALENGRKPKEKLPHPMDKIKEIEAKFSQELSTLNGKKIQKKARKLRKQIDSMNIHEIEEPSLKTQNNLITEKSNWDVKQSPTQINNQEETKNYGCKNRTYYTIKEGVIVKTNPPNSQNGKLSLDEIRKLPKFQNYDPGIPSNGLYIKNIANGIKEEELQSVFMTSQILSIKIMKGKMRGQAFVDLENETIAKELLDKFNGTIIKNRPIIIEFARKRVKK